MIAPKKTAGRVTNLSPLTTRPATGSNSPDASASDSPTGRARVRRARSGFGLVWSHVIRDPQLSITARFVYALMTTYANGDRELFPSLAELAEQAGVSESTMHRARRELVNAGHLVVEAQTKPSGATTSNLYVLNDFHRPEGGVTDDTPEGVAGDRGPVSPMTPGGVTDDTPEGVAGDTRKKDHGTKGRGAAPECGMCGRPFLRRAGQQHRDGDLCRDCSGQYPLTETGTP